MSATGPDSGAVSPPPLPLHVVEQFALGLQLRNQGYRGRFAPSPTGPLHAGNLRTALLAWLGARLARGVILLRIDDLDAPRNRPGAVEAIQTDLAWLGLTWDGPVELQSRQRGLYATVLSGLRRGGWLYPCRCSRRMLADVSAPHGASPIYPGTCRRQPPDWSARGGRLPSWRLRLPPGSIRWQERYAAPGCLDAATQVGDVVLRRADGFLAYHLATAVDELRLGITEVVRGVDLWPATGPQVALMGLLGMAPPAYGHVPLLCDGRGQRLSKRDGAEGLEGMRRRGLDAPAVIGLLAAGAGLVPTGSRLSATELLQEVRPQSLAQALQA